MAAETFEPWLSLDEVLERQSGVFRPADVRPWIGIREIHAEVRAGRWRRAHRGVFVAQNGDLTVEQERWACVLCAPPGSALGGLTAAELDGLQNFPVPETHLIIPVGSRKPHRDGVTVHYSTQLTELDVHPAREPRRTRLARSLVDAAGWESPERRARTIILAGVQQRLVRPADLRDALSRRGPCRHHPLISEAIDDAEGGIASVPEHDFELIRRQYRLPPPRRQAIARRRDGRYYLDVEWTEFGVGVEIHGTQHLAVNTWDADLDRHSELAAGGRTMLAFSSHTVRHRKVHVAQIVLKALRHRGWPG